MPVIKLDVHPRQIGQWLYEADDVEFAEAIVTFWKIWNKRNPVTCPEDYENFDCDGFIRWLDIALNEIIPIDSECCSYAWWKEK